MPRKSKSSSGSTPQRGKSSSERSKVGSNPNAAKQFADEDDFGAHAQDRNERDYASRATQAGDKGRVPGHATGDGQRTAGVGANESGPGSGSGGDVDVDIIGVGTGGSGVAASGQIRRPPAADDAQQFRETKQNPPTPAIPRGTTIDRSGGDASTTGEGQGAASVQKPGNFGDDAFAGEISNDEASGGDNAASDR